MILMWSGTAATTLSRASFDSRECQAIIRISSLAIVPQSLKEATEDDNITDDERLIITYRVFGFIMRGRKWGELDVSRWIVLCDYVILIK